MASYNEPVGRTCKYIDEVLSNLRWAEDTLKLALDRLDGIYFDDENDDGMSDLINKVKENIKDALNLVENTSNIETIRDANTKLRDWGNELVEELISNQATWF